MLLDGELDAAIFGGNMPDDPRLKSVIADPEAAGEEWYRKHRTVPINHMVVVKDSLSKSNPAAVREVFRMLLESKKAAGLPQAWRDRLRSVRLRRRAACARADERVCAGNAAYPAGLYGRATV